MAPASTKLQADDPSLLPSDEDDDDFALPEGGSDSSSDSEDDEPKAKKAKVEAPVERTLSKSAIDDLWAEFNAPAASGAPPAAATSAGKAPIPSSSGAVQLKPKAPLVKIKVKHSFVGETIEEDKMVPADSPEAVAYFALHPSKAPAPAPATSSVSSFFPDEPATSTSTPAAADEFTASAPPPPPKAGPPKRKAGGGLAAMAASLSGKPAKLTTLEKSKLDWNKFVDKEDLSDDLTKARKDGYLDKRDFLDKAQAAKEDEYDRMRRGGRR